VIIRSLEPLEWLDLQETLIEKFAEPLPNPEITRILGIEEDGRIIGFIQVEEMAIHIRHVYVDKDHRGDGTAEALVEHVRTRFRAAGKRAHLVAANPFAEKLAEYAGMKKLNGTLWEGDGT
jgi:predicted GNAT family acetyltransferase